MVYATFSDKINALHLIRKCIQYQLLKCKVKNTISSVSFERKTLYSRPMLLHLPIKLHFESICKSLVNVN